jgi:hypothetical protein
MGMFDYIKCNYPLPVKGANELEYQTKDTPAQFLDRYTIGKDGSLWHEEYDIEDHSDPKAEGLARVIGCMTRVRKRWNRVNGFTGEIRFYTFWDDSKINSGLGGWIEWSAYFKGSKLANLTLVKNQAAGKPLRSQMIAKRSRTARIRITQ